MISLTHFKLTKYSYALLDMGDQISFLVLNLNIASDAAQVTVLWNTHLWPQQ